MAIEKLKSYRDKLKSFMDPDDDWKHIFSFFVFFTAILALVSAYVYFSVSGVSASPEINRGGGGAEAGKIKNAVENINKSEAALNVLFEEKQNVSDPAR